MEYTYDNMNRIKTLISTRNSTTINSMSYEYDDNSNMILEKDVKNNKVLKSYTYDSLNRLKTANYGDSNTIEYFYDARNNREREEHTNGTGEPVLVKEYSYNGLNQLTEIKVNDIVTDTYTYNQTGAVLTHNSNVYSYDEWDNLISVNENTFKYDTNGIRTKKNNTQYVVDLNNNVAVEINGSTTAETIYGDRPLARKIVSTYYYYIYNSHGDVIGLVNESGTLINSYSFDAWGNILSQSEQLAQPIKYAGEYFDTETELYYLRARHYDPKVGRFTSNDKIEGNISNPLRINRYVYCQNNPVNRIDPTGNVYIPVRPVFETFGKLGSYNKKTEQIKATIGKQSWMLGNNDDYWSFVDGSDGKMYMWVTAKQENGLNLPSLSGNVNLDVMMYAAVSQRGNTAGGKYRKYTGAGANDNWCTSFAVWAAGQAGLSIPNHSGNYNLMNHYKDNDSFYMNDGNYVPKAGDFAFMGNNPINRNYDGTGHVGIVIAYVSKGGWVYTAEGNSGSNGGVNVVKRHQDTIHSFGSNGGTEYGLVPKKFDYTRK